MQGRSPRWGMGRPENLWACLERQVELFSEGPSNMLNFAKKNEDTKIKEKFLQ